MMHAVEGFKGEKRVPFVYSNNFETCPGPGRETQSVESHLPQYPHNLLFCTSLHP